MAITSLSNLMKKWCERKTESIWWWRDLEKNVKKRSTPTVEADGNAEGKESNENKSNHEKGWESCIS